MRRARHASTPNVAPSSAGAAQVSGQHHSLVHNADGAAAAAEAGFTAGASNDHMGNFFECVRTRKTPVASAEIGHRSVTVCHLGAISTRLGRKLQWDPAKEQFVGDEEANKMVAREQRKPWTYDLVTA